MCRYQHGPPPRPVSPRTRFAPPLRHSATRAFPPPSVRSALPPSPASAPRRPPVSAPLPMPRPALPATCFARVPSARPAVTTTRSPPGDVPLSSPLRSLASSARHPSRLRSLTLPERFVRRQPHASLTARRLRRHRCTHAVRLAALVVGTAAPRSRRPVRVSPATRFRITPRTRVRTSADASADASGSVLRTTAVSTVGSPLHSVAVAAPFRRLRPRRSPFAAAPHFGSRSTAEPLLLHTPRSGLRVCASRTFDRRLSAQPPPSAARLLLDRAYVAPIHDVLLAPDHAGLRLSCTDTRAIHACRYRKHGPIHDRHAHMMAASAARTPRIEGAFAEIATPPPIW